MAQLRAEVYTWATESGKKGASPAQITGWGQQDGWGLWMVGLTDDQMSLKEGSGG